MTPRRCRSLGTVWAFHALRARVGVKAGEAGRNIGFNPPLDSVFSRKALEASGLVNTL